MGATKEIGVLTGSSAPMRLDVARWQEAARAYRQDRTGSARRQQAARTRARAGQTARIGKPWRTNSDKVRNTRGWAAWHAD